jgi:hypothetical protein
VKQMQPWPDIPYEPWKESCTTLHLWTQIVGKYRLARAPWVNHWWHATFYVTARGLTTSLIPAGDESVQFDFDLIDHTLIGRVTDGSMGSFLLEPMTVAAFHERFLALTDELGVRIDFNGTPNEVADAIPFSKDTTHASYDAAAVNKFLASPRPGRSCAQAFSHRLPGQGQPRPSFLGQLRSRGHTLLWPHRAHASGRHTGPARRGNA